MLIYRFSVTRPKDTVEVWLIRNKYSPFEFQFVNISKGYICPCKFKTFEDAVKDMKSLKSEGKIIHYERLPDFDFKPLSVVASKFEGENKMKRERAKELLPIIQAYAEGKKIQVESHNHKWFDVTELDDDFESLNYRIKPSEKYNEIFKLKSMLEENHIPFEWLEHKDFRNGYQICYPEKDGKCECSVIEHSFSYGSQEDLLEIQGLLTADEEECDSVLGNLTADDVFQRILSHWEKTKRKFLNCKCIYLENPIYRPFKSCDELVYYWEREKVGYSANPLQMIDIWVKYKVDGRRRMIVGFGENFVEVGDKAKPITLEQLLETYTFLDNEPCGVKEK